MKLFHWFELFSFLISIAVIKKTKGTPLVFFIPFLLIINIYEVGTVRGWFSSHISNHLAGNIFMLIPFSFYFLLLKSLFQQPSVRTNVVLTMVLFMIFYVVNITAIQKSSQYNSYSYLLGSFMMIGWSCYFFFRIMTNPVFMNVLQYPFFWIFTGVMFFYLFRFIFMSYFTFMAYSNNAMYIQLFIAISNISIIILYLCISTGLLCFKPPVNKI